MPKDMLKQLSERPLEKAGKNAAYQGFLNAVKNAEDQISQLHAQDRYGRVKKMTREDCNGLMKLLKQVGLKAEDVYRNETDAETRQLVKKITALAAGSHRALLAYDEKNTMSLPALLHEVRTLTLDTRGVALKTKVGGAISSRQTLTFLDDKGREISGVFIPRKVVNIQNSIQEKLNRLADTVSDPEGKAMVKDFMSRYISNVMHEHAHKTSEWTEKQKPAALNVLLSAICSDDENDFVYKKMEMEMKKLYAAELNGRPITSKVPKNVIKAIGQAVWDLSDDINVNLFHAQMPDGARIDTRHAAVSAVADLLGIPNVVARSRPMKLIQADGSEVEGTFMTEAQGLDPGNLSEEAMGINEEAMSGKTLEEKQAVAKGIKAVADLQVLDYLCGNVDRHQNNMLYQFNDSKKLCSIQGIDNDCALGNLRPEEGEHKKGLCSLNEMRAISESMARVVEQLTPEVLRFSLRGFTLSETELDAACFRLKALQKKIADCKTFNDSEKSSILNKKGKLKFEDHNLRIVKDGDWAYVKYSDLQTVQRFCDIHGNWHYEPNNAFGMVKSAVQSLNNDYENQKKAYQGLRSEVVIGSGNRAIPSVQVKEATKARKLVELLKARTTQGRSSPQFDAMQEAAEQYALYQIQLKNRIAEAGRNHQDPDAPCERVVTTEDLEEMRKLAKKMQVKARAYLEHKGDGLHSGYDKKRIEAAKLAYKLGEDGAKLKPEEVGVSERGMKLALEEVNRRGDGRRETADLDAQKPKVFEKNNCDAVAREEKAAYQNLNR